MTPADTLTAELYAADVVANLGRIANAQHRIAVALASDLRPAVLAHLRDLGITEPAAAAYASVALDTDAMHRVKQLLAVIEVWRPKMLAKVRALAVAA